MELFVAIFLLGSQLSPCSGKINDKTSVLITSLLQINLWKNSLADNFSRGLRNFETFFQKLKTFWNYYFLWSTVVQGELITRFWWIFVCFLLRGQSTTCYGQKNRNKINQRKPRFGFFLSQLEPIALYKFHAQICAISNKNKYGPKP